MASCFAISRTPGKLIKSRRYFSFLLVSCLVCLVLLYNSIGPPTRGSPSFSPIANEQLAPSDYENVDSPNRTIHGATSPHRHPPKPTSPPRILLVSAFFPLPHSKHSQSDYSGWLKRFLGQISTDVYFFAPPNITSFIQSLRPPTSNSFSPSDPQFCLFLNTTFSSPSSIPPLHPLQQAYTHQHEIDQEKHRHSPALYAVWNAKAYFVSEAIINSERLGRTYDYVFWNDAGSFRNPHWYEVWPDPWRVASVWEEGERMSGGTRKEDLVFFPVAGLPWFAHRWWKERHGPLDVEFSEGSFFGGSPGAMQWWTQTFYTYHNHYLSRSFFIGKDQSTFNALFLLFPDRFITMYFGDVPGMDIELSGTCCWRWWYFHFWLGDKDGGGKVREAWKGLLKNWGLKSGEAPGRPLSVGKWVLGWVRWAKWMWRGDIEPPSVEDFPPVVPMKRLLRRVFGSRWTPPQRYLV